MLMQVSLTEENYASVKRLQPMSRLAADRLPQGWRNRVKKPAFSQRFQEKSDASFQLSGLRPASVF
jgi:hypothetical protein